MESADVYSVEGEEYNRNALHLISEESAPPDKNELRQVKKIYSRDLQDVYWCEGDETFYVWDRYTVRPAKQTRVLRRFNTKKGVQEVEYTYVLLPLKCDIDFLHPVLRMSMKDWNKIKSNWDLVRYGGHGSIFELPRPE
jgi:hypothetical protein